MIDLDVIFSIISLTTQMLTKGFAFIVVILIADCYLGARYKVGLGMWPFCI